MIILLAREFVRLSRKLGIRDEDLREAVQRAEKGLIDAELGSNLIKQRVARRGAGRSGGYRTIIFYRKGERYVFVHAFEKSRQATLSEGELEDYRDYARELAKLDDKAFAMLVANRGWKVIEDEQPREDVPE